MLPSKNKTEFDAFIQDTQVLEQDGFGLEVMRLPDDRILKLFRRKRRLSSQIWAPHAWRFERNAKILHKRCIRTISVESIFAIPDLQWQAVLYHELPGTPLGQWLREHESDKAKVLIERFGCFIAKLHAEGILFSSLHFGNVLVTLEQDLALIDIVDDSFRRSGALTRSQRTRNFAQIGRYTEDRALFTQTGEHTFIEAYLQAAQLNSEIQTTLLQAFLEEIHS